MKRENLGSFSAVFARLYTLRECIVSLVESSTSIFPQQSSLFYFNLVYSSVVLLFKHNTFKSTLLPPLLNFFYHIIFFSFCIADKSKNAFVISRYKITGFRFEKISLPFWNRSAILSKSSSQAIKRDLAHISSLFFNPPFEVIYSAISVINWNYWFIRSYLARC